MDVFPLWFPVLSVVVSRCILESAFHVSSSLACSTLCFLVFFYLSFALYPFKLRIPCVPRLLFKCNLYLARAIAIAPFYSGSCSPFFHWFTFSGYDCENFWKYVPSVSWFWFPLISFLIFFFILDFRPHVSSNVINEHFTLSVYGCLIMYRLNDICRISRFYYIKLLQKLFRKYQIYCLRYCITYSSHRIVQYF